MLLLACSAVVKFGLDAHWCLGSLVTTVTTCHDWPNESQCSMWPAVPVPGIKETHSLSPRSLLILCFSGMFCGLEADAVQRLWLCWRQPWDFSEPWECVRPGGNSTLQPGQGSIALVQGSTSLEGSGRELLLLGSGWQAPTPPSLAISHVWHWALPGTGARILEVCERVGELPALPCRQGSE